MLRGLDAAIDRASRTSRQVADMIFAESSDKTRGLSRFTSAVQVPVLANITEFGKTPLFTVEQLRQVGVAMVLYPLSAFRAMSKAALQVYEEIRTKGTQSEVLSLMQTRDELYQCLNYHAFEAKLDELFAKEKKS